MADLYGTLVAANAAKITTGITVTGPALKFFEIDFGVDIRQADGAREVTWLVYNFAAEMGWTPVIIGNLQADAGGNAGQRLRFAIEHKGGEIMSVDTAANHGYVYSATIEEPTVHYSVQGAAQASGLFSAAMTAKLQAETAWPYKNDAGADATIDLSNAVCTVFTL